MALTPGDSLPAAGAGFSKPALLRQEIGLLPMAAMVAVLVFLALLSGSSAIANSIGRRAPAQVLGLWPANGLVEARAASLQIEGGEAATVTAGGGQAALFVSAQAGQLAASALMHEPSAIRAVRTLALFHHGQGNNGKARRLMELASRLSRRDSVTNLWLVEDSLRRQDLARSMQFIDATLRTDSRASSLLLPQLVGLLPQAGAQLFFVALLRENPPWMHDFWTAILQHGGAVEHAADLRIALHQADISMAAGHDAQLIVQLVADQRFTQAFALYALAADQPLQPAQAKSAELIVPFRTGAQFPPLDWHISSGAAYGTALDQVTGQVQVSALRGAGGPVARRLVPLGEGIYQLEVKTDAPPDRMSASVACAHLAGARTFALSLAPPGGSAITFEQPSACKYAWLSFSLQQAPPATDTDLEIAIGPVSLRRISD